MKGTMSKTWEVLLHDLKVRVLLVLLLGGIIGLGVPSMLDLFYWDKNVELRPDCQLPPDFRLNSLPNMELESRENQRSKCNELKSCWDDTVGNRVAPCYHPHPSKYSYEVTLKTECSVDQNTRLHATAVGPDPPTGAKRIPRVQMSIEEISDHLVTVRFFDDGHMTGFESDQILKYNSHRENGERCNRKDRMYDLSNTPDIGRQLFVDVKRRNGPSVFNTNFGALIFAEQYIELTTVLPSHHFYGLGQGRHTTFSHNLSESRTWTLFAGQDQNWGHGVHPFYLCLENDGKAHGVLLEHSNALEITTQDVPSITYRSTGSSMVFHILMGPTPSDVVRQLTELVGRPPLPPYWALGHHVCRNGDSIIKNPGRPIEIVRNINRKRIPQESDCWSDSLASQLEENWTALANFTSFAEELHENSQRLLLIQAPHELLSPSSDKNENRYVRTEDKKSNVIGRLNHKEVLYPNYFKDLVQWSKDKLETFMNLSGVTFDGYLLVNNTPVDERESRTCSTNHFLNAPGFVPGRENLWSKTMCLDTCFEWYSRESCTRLNARNHYNLHNLYGYKHLETIANATGKIAESKNKRPFLASMSTFTGSGKYGGHFSYGSNNTWEDMKVALVQSLEFNLYGIPMVGSPTCGYHFKKGLNIRDLCSRWAQLSAFQPLVLSYHSGEDPMLDTPVMMDEIVSSVSAASLQLRYSLLPYLYTLFYEASVNGTPVMRPLFYEFPTDSQARSVDEQFMWGSGILISPVVHANTTTFKAYFPKGTWYDFHDGSLELQSDKGEFKNLTGIEYHINIHLRGGHIIASQKHARLTEEGRNSTYKIRVALDRTKDDKQISATGQIYIDDGLTHDGPKLLVNMVAFNNNLTLTPKFLNGDENSFDNFSYNLQLEEIHILGLKRTSAYHCEINKVKVHCDAKVELSTLSLRNPKVFIGLTNQTVVTWTSNFNK